MTGQLFLFVILMAFFAFPIVAHLLCKIDRYGWEKPCAPDMNATIVGTKTEEVQYIKNGARYRTVIAFSDGFYFITHKTKVDERFWTYRISIDKELATDIILLAMEKHEKAVKRYQKKKG